MKFLNVFPILFLFSCGAMPQFFQTADDVLDDAISIKVDKSALQREPDLTIQVELKNKDQKP